MAVIQKEVFFYDFRLGGKGTNRKQWAEKNIKLPAGSPLHALYLYKLFLQGLVEPKSHAFRNISFHLGPGKKGNNSDIIYQLRFSVRRIIEYKVTYTNGRTQPRYKKVGVYYISDEYKVRQTDR